MSDTNTDPNVWADNLDQTRVQIWREALTHLRHLSDEVWNGFKIFMAFNAVILALISFILLMTQDRSLSLITLAILAVFGIGLTMIGLYILKRNRVYYLQMLLKKTLIEDEFGFYQVKFSGSETDLAFPWRLKPEVVPELKQKPAEWVERQIRGPGTMAKWLFITFESFIALYALLLLFLLFICLR